MKKTTYRQCNQCHDIKTKKEWLDHGDSCPSCYHTGFKSVTNPDIPVKQKFVVLKPLMQKKEPQNTLFEQGYTPMEPSKSSIPWKAFGILFLLSVIGVFLMFSMNRVLDQSQPAKVTPIATIAIERVEATSVPVDAQFSIERPIDEVQSEVVLDEYLLRDIWSKGKMDIIIFMSLFLILLNACGYLDATRSHQTQDSTVAVIVTVIGLVLGLRVLQTAMIQLQPIWLVILIWILYVGSLIMLGSFVRAGTLDFTPAAMMLGSIAIAGGVFLNNLGGIQTILKVESSPLFTLPSLFILGKTKQLWTYGGFSLLVYGHLILALLFAFIEIIKTGKGQKKSYSGFWFSIIVVVAFMLIRLFHPENITISDPKLNWIKEILIFLVQPGVLVFVAVIVNLLRASNIREKLDGMGVNYTEYVIGNLRIVSPYDVILFQTLLATLLVMLIGHI